MVKRFEVYLLNLDPEITKSPKNTRPCVVVSPDELNRNLPNAIVTPLSSATAKYPTRITTEFLKNERLIVLDQIRTVDQQRLVKKIGEIDKSAHKETLERLQEIFAE